MFRISVRRSQEPPISLDISAPSFSIGRGADNHVVLPSTQVSTRHAAVELRRDSVYIADCQSRNGTFVNNELVEGERVLAPDDCIQICEFTLAVDVLTIRPAVSELSDFLLGPPALDPALAADPPSQPPLHALGELPVTPVGVSDEFPLWEMVQERLGDPMVQELVVRVEGDRGARSMETAGREVLVAGTAQIAELAARLADLRLSAERPIAEAHVGEFTLHAYDRSVATGGPVLVFVRDCARESSLDMLVAEQRISVEDATFLRAAIRELRSVVVCGATGEARHVLLTALGLECGGTRRRVVIHRGRLGPGLSAGWLALEGRDDAHELVRSAVRLRPEVIIVFEIGGREVAELLGASRPSTVLCSVPALHARGALLSLQAALGGWLALAPGPFAQSFVASCFDVLVVAREGVDGPEVASIFELQGSVLRERGSRAGRPASAMSEGVS
jgi:Flp pilus assembly CpaF family ATPase